jgi:hypothetical protein
MDQDYNNCQRLVRLLIDRYDKPRLSRATNMPDAAQVQEAVMPSRKSSGFVASGTGPVSTEASSGLEGARRLSDKSSSSNAEDMREWCSWQPTLAAAT